MDKPTLTEIRKDVLAKGGTYKKERFLLNGNDAYRVNGKLLTKHQMIEAFQHHEL